MTSEDDELGNIVPAQNPDDPFNPEVDAAPSNDDTTSTETDPIAALLSTKKQKLTRLATKATGSAKKSEVEAEQKVLASATQKKTMKATQKGGAAKALKVATSERKDEQLAAAALAKVAAA